MENKLDELSHISGSRLRHRSDCDTDHRLLVATLKVRLGKRQRQNSIPPLNLEELKEDKAVQFRVDKQQQLEGMCTELEAVNLKGNSRQLFQTVK